MQLAKNRDAAPIVPNCVTEMQRLHELLECERAIKVRTVDDK